jgi:hypothetical protein
VSPSRASDTRSGSSFDAGSTRSFARAASVFLPAEKPDQTIAPRRRPGSESEPGAASTSAIGPGTAKL